MRRIKLIGAALLLLCLCACGNTEDGSWNGMEKTGSLELHMQRSSGWTTMRTATM